MKVFVARSQSQLQVAVLPIASLLLSVFIVFLTPLDFKDTFIYKYFLSPVFKSIVPNTLLLSIIFPTFVALKTYFYPVHMHRDEKIKRYELIQISSSVLYPMYRTLMEYYSF